MQLPEHSCTEKKQQDAKQKNSLPIHSCGMKGEGVFCKQGILLFTTLLLGGSEPCHFVVAPSFCGGGAGKIRAVGIGFHRNGEITGTGHIDGAIRSHD